MPLDPRELSDYLKSYQYPINPWGLTQNELRRVAYDIVDNGHQYICEFGSGTSTQFLVDLSDAFGLDLQIDTFDHNEEFAYAGDAHNVRLMMRDLLFFDDRSFSILMMRDSEGDAAHGDLTVSDHHILTHAFANTRPHNVFYGVRAGDLRAHYDFVILDGPFGNGRGLAFALLQGRLPVGSTILIDDALDYDFLPMFRRLSRGHTEMMAIGGDRSYAMVTMVKDY